MSSDPASALCGRTFGPHTLCAGRSADVAQARYGTLIEGCDSAASNIRKLSWTAEHMPSNVFYWQSYCAVHNIHRVTTAVFPQDHAGSAHNFLGLRITARCFGTGHARASGRVACRSPCSPLITRGELSLSWRLPHVRHVSFVRLAYMICTLRGGAPHLRHSLEGGVPHETRPAFRAAFRTRWGGHVC